MRKRFDELTVNGKNKFFKRLKLSDEESSSCTHNVSEKPSRENINKTNREAYYTWKIILSKLILNELIIVDIYTDINCN